MFNRFVVALVCSAMVILVGCTKKNGPPSVTESSGRPAPVEGVEKVKPAPGTGNVQGKVLYNGKPVENIDVKLCETFSRFLGGCSGKSYSARTDKNGEYVITNAERMVYEGLLARV